MSKTNQATDVLVIGGGVVGLATADALAREGASVALLERAQCGRESSWAGAGIIQSGSWHRQDPLVQMQRECVRDYGAFAADLRERTGIDPEYFCCGSLEILIADQQFRMAKSEAKVVTKFDDEYGRRVLELLTPQQARAREPAVTDDSLGAKYDATTGQVRSPRLLAALRVACEKQKVQIVEECEVKGLILQSGRVTGVRTVQGTRAAGHVVLAAGCWSSRLDEYLTAIMPTVPVRGQMVLLKLPAPSFSHVIERGRCYLVPRQDGHVVVGATQEPEAGFEKATTAGGVQHLLEAAIRLVPSIAEASLEQMWAGLRPGTPDGRPYIGPVPAMDGLIAATGHFRSGLTLTPVTARVVADLVLRGKTPYDLERCRPGRKLEDRLISSTPA